MTRRALLTVVALASIALGACGSDSDEGDDAGDSLPPATDPVDEPVGSGVGSEIVDPTPIEGPRPAPDVGVDVEVDVEVVVSLSVGGGFSTREVAFQNPPALLVTGDGRVITLAAGAAVFPGPLVVPHVEQTITPQGVRALLAAADDAGLLTDLEFDANSGIADAPTTTLEIATSDATFVHEAYALGLGGPPLGGAPLGGDDARSSDANATLQEFVDALSDLAGVVGAENLGPETDHVPSGYQVVALDVAADAAADVAAGFEPTIVDWPVDEVSLADLAATGECAVIDASTAGEVFRAATQLTRFAEGGATFTLLVRPDYPGQTC